MRKKLKNFVPRLNASVDWFIPAHLKESRDILQAVRMFLFSHLLGPFLGQLHHFAVRPVLGVDLGLVTAPIRGRADQSDLRPDQVRDQR